MLMELLIWCILVLKLKSNNIPDVFLYLLSLWKLQCTNIHTEIQSQSNFIVNYYNMILVWLFFNFS